MATKQQPALTPDSVSTSAPASTPAPKESSLTKEEKLEIFDTLMFEGAYTEVVKLSTRVSAEFTTRTADDYVSISKTIETLAPETQALVDQYLSLLHISHALVSFKGQDLSSLAPYPGRYDILKTIPAAVVDTMQKKLGVFDKKVQESVEYSSENF